MANSVIVPVRLKIEELTRLDEMMASDVQGCENRCEFMRLLLHRESNRRKNLGKPVAADWQTDFRKGRPAAA